MAHTNSMQIIKIYQVTRHNCVEKVHYFVIMFSTVLIHNDQSFIVKYKENKEINDISNKIMVAKYKNKNMNQ